MRQLPYVEHFGFSSTNLLEQCNFTGGRDSSLAISVFFNIKASSTVLPFTHSVARELEAMADPHPNVLNLASMIFPFSSTLICSFMTSPQAGAPTNPVPTFLSFLSREPTLRGFSQCSMTWKCMNELALSIEGSCYPHSILPIKLFSSCTFVLQHDFISTRCEFDVCLIYSIVYYQVGIQQLVVFYWVAITFLRK